MKLYGGDDGNSREPTTTSYELQITGLQSTAYKGHLDPSRRLEAHTPRSRQTLLCECKWQYRAEILQGGVDTYG